MPIDGRKSRLTLYGFLAMFLWAAGVGVYDAIIIGHGYQSISNFSMHLFHEYPVVNFLFGLFAGMLIGHLEAPQKVACYRWRVVRPDGSVTAIDSVPGDELPPYEVEALTRPIKIPTVLMPRAGRLPDPYISPLFDTSGRGKEIGPSRPRPEHPALGGPDA